MSLVKTPATRPYRVALARAITCRHQTEHVINHIFTHKPREVWDLICVCMKVQPSSKAQDALNGVDACAAYAGQQASPCLTACLTSHVTSWTGIQPNGKVRSRGKTGHANDCWTIWLRRHSSTGSSRSSYDASLVTSLEEVLQQVLQCKQQVILEIRVQS